MRTAKLTRSGLRALAVLTVAPTEIFGEKWSWANIEFWALAFEDEYSKDDVHHFEFHGRIEILGRDDVEPRKIQGSYVANKPQDDKNPWGREVIEFKWFLDGIKAFDGRFESVGDGDRIRFRTLKLNRA